MDAQINTSYQLPPKAIADLIDAPPTPGARLSPSGKKMLLLSRPNLPSIEEVARRELRLAGIRINPLTNGSSRSFYYNGMVLKDLENFEETKVSGLPKDARIENISWSSNGHTIAFTNTLNEGIELWLVDVKTAKAEKISEPIINDAMGGLPFRWFSDSKTILYKSVLINRGRLDTKSKVPLGPIIQENKGGKSPLRTFQDLLKNPNDEAQFEYYTSSQLMLYRLETGETTPFGEPGIIKGYSTSPDGEYVMISMIQKPFSYVVPYSRFPFHITILDRKGNKVKTLAKIPLAESIPQGFGAVRVGPRSFQWRTDEPATLVWVEAQDGGDPKKKIPIRDKMYALTFPFIGDPEMLISFELRYGGVEWGNNELAIVYEWQWQSRQIITSRFNPKNKNGKEVVFNRSWEDSYSNPGDFEKKRNKYGRSVLLTKNEGKTLYLMGLGASPEGNQPFVDEFDLNTKKTKRLWQSAAPYFEYPIAILDEEKGVVLTRRESNKKPANYFLRSLKTEKIKQITHFENPYQSLIDVKKEQIKYKRTDGIELTGTLYLPAGYNKEKDGRLPVFMWAYPREFKSKDAAGQVTNSPHEFIRIGWFSPLFWVTQGFAVLDDFGMPIVGEGDEEPNETFVEQLVAGAEAAVNKLVEMGIADRDRIAVGGHSYGAFMTANLLAHTNLFSAGIARSGAYNRTLTPFGFQSEERTLWEAPNTYFKMSPFTHADKIKTPLLLIHGEADNNSGTYPMQSERFYGALKGHGATARLVMLPHESHGYQARESIMHMLWEMTNWLTVYVKKKVLIKKEKMENT